MFPIIFNLSQQKTANILDSFDLNIVEIAMVELRDPLRLLSYRNYQDHLSLELIFHGIASQPTDP